MMKDRIFLAVVLLFVLFFVQDILRQSWDDLTLGQKNEIGEAYAGKSRRVNLPRLQDQIKKNQLSRREAKYYRKR
jgi:hypothetical protein